MIVAQLEISATEAFSLLRGHASASGRTMEDVVTDIVDLLHSPVAECTDPFTTGTMVSVADIEASAVEWQVFRRAALEQGFLAVHATLRRFGGTGHPALSDPSRSRKPNRRVMELEVGRRARAAGAERFAGIGRAGKSGEVHHRSGYRPQSAREAVHLGGAEITRRGFQQGDEVAMHIEHHPVSKRCELEVEASPVVRMIDSVQQSRIHQSARDERDRRRAHVQVTGELLWRDAHFGSYPEQGAEFARRESGILPDPLAVMLHHIHEFDGRRREPVKAVGLGGLGTHGTSRLRLLSGCNRALESIARHAIVSYLTFVLTYRFN